MKKILLVRRVSLCSSVLLLAAGELAADGNPDLLIGKSPTLLRGSNVFNNSGAGQTVSKASRKGRTVKFYNTSLVRNSSEPINSSNFKTTLTYSRRDARVVCFDRHGFQNITAQISGSSGVNFSCEFFGITPTGIFEMETRVKPKRSARAKHKKISLIFTGSEIGAASNADTVKAASKAR